MKEGFGNWLSIQTIPALPALITAATLLLGAAVFSTVLEAVGILVYLGVVLGSDNLALFMRFRSGVEHHDAAMPRVLLLAVILAMWTILFLARFWFPLQPNLAAGPLILLALILVISMGSLFFIFREHLRLYMEKKDEEIDMDRRILEDRDRQFAKLETKTERVVVEGQEISLADDEDA